jgi:hypothetical protein
MVVNASVFAVLAATAAFMNTTVRRHLSDTWIRVDDYLGISSPFAPPVQVPRVGLVPRIIVVIAIGLIAASMAYATGRRSSSAVVVSSVAGAWWVLQPRGRIIAIVATVVVVWIINRIPKRSPR